MLKYNRLEVQTQKKLYTNVGEYSRSRETKILEETLDSYQTKLKGKATKATNDRKIQAFAIFKGPIQEIRDFHWLKVLYYGPCTGRYQYHIRNNNNGSIKCKQQHKVSISNTIRNKIYYIQY